MQMIDVMKRLAELDSANPNVVKEGESGVTPFAVKEATDKKKCPPMSHIKKMCQDGKSVAEICKMHPGCDQKELKQMVADCKKKLSEGSKPDFLDLDKDGNKKEPMSKAAQDAKKKKKIKESYEDDNEDKEWFSDLDRWENAVKVKHDGGIVRYRIPGNRVGIDPVTVAYDDDDNVVGEWGYYIDDAPFASGWVSTKTQDDTSDVNTDDDLTLESIRMITGIKKTIAECGIDAMSMLGETPQNTTPASINITAANGPELSGMLKDIMQLAGMRSAGGEEEPLSAVAQVAEPTTNGDDSTSTMRGMMDKLNQSGEDGEDGMSVAQGDVDNDGDHDMDDHEVEKEKEMMDSYDNTPSNPNDVPSFDANRYAHKENQPGQGDRMDGTAPKAYATFEEKLMDEYTKFINEAKKPSAGMTKKEKSAVVKKAKAGKDIGKKGPGFEKVAKKAAAKYGSKEKGEKVAAAAMWKQQAKK